MISETCWSTDRISFPGFPFSFESGDIKITYRFATLVEYAELPHELTSHDPRRAEPDTHGM